MTDEQRQRVERATLCVPRAGAQATLITGGLVLTNLNHAALSLQSMADAHGIWSESIRTAAGQLLELSLLSLDLVSHCAVFGTYQPAEGESADRIREFDDFYFATPAVQLAKEPVSAGDPLHLFTVLDTPGRWMSCEATSPDGLEMITAFSGPAVADVDALMPGAALVNAAGELVGVLSYFEPNAGEDRFRAAAVRPISTLPAWLLKRYLVAA